MRKERIDGRETRQRLLAAAAEVFADKGYWETSNADICEKAGANTAAVNYHFGSKEDLYVEAWKYAYKKSVDAHPPDGGVGPDAPVEERLRGRIRAFIQRIADPDICDLDVAHKEMACPTGILTEVIEEATKPMRQAFEGIIREMLGPKAGEEQVCYWQMSIMALCFGPMIHMRHLRKMPNAPRPPDLPVDLDVEAFAEHTACFILEGLTSAGGRLSEANGPLAADLLSPLSLALLGSMLGSLSTDPK
jgi:AcrR family transcriptional regulator